MKLFLNVFFWNKQTNKQVWLDFLYIFLVGIFVVGNFWIDDI